MGKFVSLLMLFTISIPAQVTVVPIMLSDDGLVINTYTIDGQSARILVDTGATTSMIINRNIATHIHHNSSIYITSLTSKVLCNSTGLICIIGIGVMRIPIIDSNINYDAILGLDWLIANNATIDIANMRLIY